MLLLGIQFLGFWKEYSRSATRWLLTLALHDYVDYGDRLRSDVPYVCLPSKIKKMIKVKELCSNQASTIAIVTMLTIFKTLIHISTKQFIKFRRKLIRQYSNK